jgi:hypothetical protein
VRAAGQHADASPDSVVAIPNRNAGRHPTGYVEGIHPRTAQDRGAGGGRTLGEHTIEMAAVDDGGGHFSALDADAAAMSPVEPRRPRDGADGFAGKIELSKGLEAEDTGAVHRTSDLLVLFEDENRQALRGQQAGGAETGRAGSDHQNIPFVRCWKS